MFNSKKLKAKHVTLEKNIFLNKSRNISFNIKGIILYYSELFLIIVFDNYSVIQNIKKLSLIHSVNEHQTSSIYQRNGLVY